MEKFKAPSLPKMLNGSVMCVDSNAWNLLLEYINAQTKCINETVDTLNKLGKQELDDAEAIRKIAASLKEHLEE